MAQQCGRQFAFYLFCNAFCSRKLLQGYSWGKLLCGLQQFGGSFVYEEALDDITGFKGGETIDGESALHTGFEFAFIAVDVTQGADRKSTRLNSSHVAISYAV